jgi:hypothetical protein
MTARHWDVPLWDGVNTPFVRGKELRLRLAKMGMLPRDIERYEKLLRELRPNGIQKRLKKVAN